MRTPITDGYRLSHVVVLLLAYTAVTYAQAPSVLEIGSRRELFVDDYLIDSMDGVELRLHKPRLAPRAESPPPRGGSYATIIYDSDRYHLYYRGAVDGDDDIKFRYAYYYMASEDGIEWEKPDLGLFEKYGEAHRNMVLEPDEPITHNFSPFLDTRPGVPSSERFKALGGGSKTWSTGEGLYALVSADGIHWKKLQDDPVIPEGNDAHPSEHYFDSQNVAFWSESEQLYVCFYRTWLPKVPGKRGVRAFSRCTSKDFVTWSRGTQYALNLPEEQFYTNATSPYFRAPHIYIALPLRYLPWSGGDIHRYPSDTILLTSRGPEGFRRTFGEAFIRPGRNAERWAWPNPVSTSTTVNVIPTGIDEMSIYIRDARYVLRVDGFASVHATGQMGEFVTKPLTFNGGSLRINGSTSAAGRIMVEIQDQSGQPIPGYALEDCKTIVCDEIERVVEWERGSDVSELSGQTIRLRFKMRDADLYALRFK
jgi:hypothetical protein